MPDCYLLAACHGSVIDKTTNNFTIFSLTEAMQLPLQELPSQPKLVLPFDVVAFWKFNEDEFGSEFEWRLAFEVGGRISPLELVYDLGSDKSRHRFRLHGFPVLETGEVVLRAQWREKGAERWQSSSASWPMTIELTATATSRGAED